MRKQFWNSIDEHPIVGGYYRSWEEELKIKENIKQRKEKKLKEKKLKSIKNENSL